VPAAGICQVNGGWVNGGSDTGLSGLTFDGVHNDNQVTTAAGVNKVVNNLDPKDASLERLIEAAKNGADYTIDLSQQRTEAVSTTSGEIISMSGTGVHIGGPDDFKIVYASGRVVDGVYQEAPLNFSGNGRSYGLLVIEVNNPDIISGQYTWVGLVLVVCNQRINQNNTSLMNITGGGNDLHIIGGVCLYFRNYAEAGSSIYGKNAYRTRGTSDLMWSWDAVNMALKPVPMPLQVRSWRKLE